MVSFRTQERIEPSEECAKMRRVTPLLLFLCYAAAAAVGQTGGGRIPSSASGNPQNALHTPDRGSDERKALMDTLRAPVEKKLRQQVVFQVGQLMVQDGWAFFIGKPQQPDGTPVDYSRTVYKDAIEAGAFDDGIVALLHNVNGKWRVIQYVIGATDVPYVDWDKKYHAPKAIFGEVGQ